MAGQAMLIEYGWCTGCHTCEVACQMEHGLDVGQFGVKVSQVGPWRYDDGSWEYTFIPTFTDYCNLCAERQAGGKQPMCVAHCQARCLKLIDMVDAAEEMAGKGKVLLQAKGAVS